MNQKKLSSSGNYFDQLSILKQLPGYIACIDKEERFNYYVNPQCAFINGYANTDDIYGEKISDMRCKASESAPLWIEQNQLILSSLNPLRILDIHPYYKDEIKILLSQKKPLFDDKGNAIGIIFYGHELNQNLLSNIIMSIAKGDKKYQKRNNIFQRSYYIGHSIKHTELTDRELECLFYLVRGKTAKQTASLLFISKRTVESHMVNIKSKLNCATKSDLIEKAITDNLINLIPERIINNIHNGLSVIL